MSIRMRPTRLSPKAETAHVLDRACTMEHERAYALMRPAYAFQDPLMSLPLFVCWIRQRAAHVAALTSLHLLRASGARVRLARQSRNLSRGVRAYRVQRAARSGGGGAAAAEAARHTAHHTRNNRARHCRERRSDFFIALPLHLLST